MWNNGTTNIFDSKLRKGIYASYILATQPFLSLKDRGKKIYLNMH
jgi:hypothetical protein